LDSKTTEQNEIIHCIVILYLRNFVDFMIMYVNDFAVFIMCGGDTCDIGELLPGWLFDGPFISQVIG